MYRLDRTLMCAATIVLAVSTAPSAVAQTTAAPGEAAPAADATAPTATSVVPTQSDLLNQQQPSGFDPALVNTQAPAPAGGIARTPDDGAAIVGQTAAALLEVGPSVFFSLLVIAVAFMPVFTLVDQDGLRQSAGGLVDGVAE